VAVSYTCFQSHILDLERTMNVRPRHVLAVASVALPVLLGACTPPAAPAATTTTTTTTTTVPATPVFTYSRTNVTATFLVFGPFGPFLWGNRSNQFGASTTSDITGTVTPACVGVPSEPDYNPTVTVGIYPIRSGVGPVVGTRFTGTCGSPVSVALPTQTWGSLDSITVAVQQADCGTAACTSLPQNLSFSLRGDGSGAAVGAL
jgi:hypothetical protein